MADKKQELDLKVILRDLEINQGDILDVSSDITSFMYHFMEEYGEFKVDVILDALKEMVGEEGTILIRSYNWEFCSGAMFDYYKTKSKVGSLGNLVLKRADFKRTKHPMYSYMVWGKLQKELCEIDTVGAWDLGSVFDVLYQRKAKNLLLGSNIDSFTFVHYVEQQTGTKYRYIKSFASQYKDEQGMIAIKDYEMYVRDLERNVVMCMQGIRDIFLESLVMKEKHVFWGTVAVIDYEQAFGLVKEDIVTNKSRNLCTYLGQ